MSNISQTSNDLKKKLSFNDYNTPVQQNAVKPAEQLVGSPVGQQSINDKDSTTASQHDVTPLSTRQQASMSDVPASQHASKTTKCHNSTAAQQLTGPKIKATFYLSEEDNQALTDIFIKRLQEKKKTDKSALISEALRLLYKKEMR